VTAHGRADAVSVLIVDDHASFRTAANLVFDVLDGFEVVGEATSGEEALDLAASLAPALVIMDIRLPGINGVDATRRLVAANPQTVVLLVSTYDAGDLPLGAASCGALAYVHKEHLDADLVERLWSERDLGLWRTA
jgi:two-component system, NarL family, invasion response regulator UvrY